MPATQLDAGASAPMRPKSLSASSLLQRAAIGILVLTVFVVLSAWLYDASIATAVDAAPISKTTHVSK